MNNSKVPDSHFHRFWQATRDIAHRDCPGHAVDAPSRRHCFVQHVVAFQDRGRRGNSAARRAAELCIAGWHAVRRLLEGWPKAGGAHCKGRGHRLRSCGILLLGCGSCLHQRREGQTAAATWVLPLRHGLLQRELHGDTPTVSLGWLWSSHASINSLSP